ncbi:MAG: hypothetical protein V3U10_02465 [Bacteroidota bacterium]
MENIRDLVLNSMQQFLNRVFDALPNILAAAAIFIFGWLLAKVIRVAVVKFLMLIRFNIVAWKAGIDAFLEKGGIKRNCVELIGQLFYWLIMLIVLVAAVDALGIQVASDLLNRILLYVPNIIAAVVVLVLGLFFANFISGVIQTSASNANFSYPGLLGQVSRYAMIVFVAAIALEQLGVGQQIVVQGFTILFGAVCLAAALAFGIGGKDLASRLLDRMIKERGAGKKGGVIE